MRHTFSPDKLYHLGNLPTKLKDFTGEQKATMKPRGLWYGIGDSWVDWCSSGMPAWLEDKRCYELEVDYSNMLVLRAPDEILAFGEEYLRDPTFCRDTWHIEWERVAEKRGGIEISPYQWSLRLDSRTSWYYGWDCASGCVWNPDLITAMIPLSSSVAQEG